MVDSEYSPDNVKYLKISIGPIIKIQKSKDSFLITLKLQ